MNVLYMLVNNDCGRQHDSGSNTNVRVAAKVWSGNVTRHRVHHAIADHKQNSRKPSCISIMVSGGVAVLSIDVTHQSVAATCHVPAQAFSIRRKQSQCSRISSHYVVDPSLSCIRLLYEKILETTMRTRAYLFMKKSFCSSVTTYFIA
uniref:Uncharacterized protein n=1 Tax=Hyaloperonospora arabidopsidis (strain Emoy2) TaxID=559515 RepID=M4BN42_HYAAE